MTDARVRTTEMNGGAETLPSGSAKLSDVAYAKIAGRIASGDFQVGRKLPSEYDLAEQLSVSRPIVREALARLRDDGLVVSRRGSGTYVRRAPIPGDQRLTPLSSIADMRRCLEFRIAFEGETAAHAAAALTEAGRAGLDAALEQLDSELALDEISIESDFAFHLAVAKATENRFFFTTMSSMREPITVGMGITRNFTLLRTRERLLYLQQEHHDIREAIVARDPEAARRAMQRHLENAMQRVFEGTLS